MGLLCKNTNHSITQPLKHHLSHRTLAVAQVLAGSDVTLGAQDVFGLRKAYTVRCPGNVKELVVDIVLSARSMALMGRLMRR